MSRVCVTGILIGVALGTVQAGFAQSQPATATPTESTAAPAAAVSPLDTILAIAACVAALAAVGTTVYMMTVLNTAINS